VGRARPAAAAAARAQRHAGAHRRRRAQRALAPLEVGAAVSAPGVRPRVRRGRVGERVAVAAAALQPRAARARRGGWRGGGDPCLLLRVARGVPRLLVGAHFAEAYCHCGRHDAARSEWRAAVTHTGKCVCLCVRGKRSMIAREWLLQLLLKFYMSYLFIY